MTDENLKLTCNGICKKVQVKKPSGEGRYSSGQAHCQICNTWIDHKGAHMKDGSTATKDSLGWFCNCCNYRVRQKPRNKVYKEKLREWLTRDQVKTGKSVRITHENNEKSNDTIKQDTNYAAMIFTKKINYKRNMNTKDEENSETEKINDEIKEIENNALKKYEVDQKQKKQIENSKQTQKFTKYIDFSMIDNSNNEKSSELKEKFIESQKLMEEILLGKKELHDMFLKLKEKINHINPNMIRKISRKL